MQIKFPILTTLMTLSLGASAQTEAAPAPAAASAPAAAPSEETYSTIVAEDPAAPTYNEAPTEEPPQGPPGPSAQMSLYMGSPIWLSDAPLDAGFEFELRRAIKVGIFVPEMSIGSRWNWVNVDNLRDDYPEVENPGSFKGDNLNGFWLSLGLRIEPKTTGKLQPYLSAAFDANMWGASFERHDVCGFWNCSSVRTYNFAPGFSGRLGLRFAPKPFIGLDIGVKPAMSFQGWAFEKTQTWVQPYGGLTIIMDPTPKSGGRRR